MVLVCPLARATASHTGTSYFTLRGSHGGRRHLGAALRAAGVSPATPMWPAAVCGSAVSRGFCKKGADGAASGRLLVSRKASSQQAEAQGGPSLDGPILADFLAMGAGRASAPLGLVVPPPAGQPASLISPSRGAGVPPADAEANTPTAVNAAEDFPEADLPVRERRYVVAALQRGEAVGQATAETPPRVPVPVEPRLSGDVPAVFGESYARYAKSYASYEEFAKRRIKASLADDKDSKRSNQLRKLRIRILPWHRTALQKMVCRAVFFHFLQELKQARGIRATWKALLHWEVKQAQTHSEAGKVVGLVKYLAETELHLSLGPRRRAAARRAGPTSRNTPADIRNERTQLVRHWGVKARDLNEDAVFRIFLDGKLSWPRLRNLLGAAPLQSTSFR